MNSGIYTIENIVDYKLYVGYATNLQRRLLAHKNALINDYHPNTHLQNAVNKYGIENFEFEILEECPISLLCALEHYWATTLKVHNNKYGYNINPTHPYNNGRGIRYKHSNDVKKRIGEKSREWHANNPNALKGKKLKLTDDQKKLRSEKHKGKKHKKETILKMKEIGKMRVYSEDHKDKLREFNRINSQKNKKSIYQYDLDGNLIAEFSSLIEAGKTVGISCSTISNNLAGRIKTAKGFKWKYKN